MITIEVKTGPHAGSFTQPGEARLPHPINKLKECVYAYDDREGGYLYRNTEDELESFKERIEELEEEVNELEKLLGGE